MKPKILTIIGGAGFLGRNLIARLLRDTTIRVRCLDRVAFPGPSLDPSRFTQFVGGARESDLLAQALAGADAVWIRAGLLGGARGVDAKHWRDYLDVNLELVSDVLAACDRSEIKRIFFDSTVMVFGDSADLISTTPDAEPEAHSFYAATKLVSEKLLRAWSHTTKDRSVQISRYAHVHAAQTPDVMFHMTAAAVKGGPIRVFGDGDQRIDFVHIDDVVEANFAMLDRSPRFAIYHISADRPISLFELATRVNEWSGARARIEWVPDAGGAQARFKQHVSGLRWEETIQELGLNQPRSLDSMIHETLNALRPSAALSG